MNEYLGEHPKLNLAHCNARERELEWNDRSNERNCNGLGEAIGGGTVNKVADAAAGLVSIPIISGVIKGVGEGVQVVMDQAEKNRMLQLRDELTQYQDWGVSQGVSDELVKRYETIIERLGEAQVRAFGSACMQKQ